jgi:chemotaxis protein methyltransferase CheR
MNIAAILHDPAYPALKAHVLEYTGLHYYDDKDEDLAARFSRRITARNLRSCTEYRSLLAQSGVPSEYDSLIGELTIGETYFFRQAEHFEILRTSIIPELLERNSESRSLRIWSAGCATGAEPYSVSLLLWDHFTAALQGWSVEILGTDINPSALQRARTATFGPWALREVPIDIRSRCFDHDPHAKTWKLRPQFTRGVVFQRHNLVSSNFFPGQHGDAFDIIFCRNVVIYFSNDRIRALAEHLYHSLTPGGTLLVGHAELSLPGLERFSAVTHERTTFYVRPFSQFVPPPAQVPAPRRPPVIVPPTPPPRRPVPRPAPPPVVVPVAATPTLSQLTDVRLLAGRGEWAAAEGLCRGFIETAPLRAEGHFTLGLILEHTSVRDAETAFRRSIYLDRSFALGHYHLGCCLQRMGETRPARKAFENVLTILAERAADELVPHAEGMVVSELLDLANMHLHSMDTR